MYHSQFGGATKCSLGIYPPPRPSPAGGEGDEGAPPREGEGDEGAPPREGEGDEGAPPPDGEGEAVVSPRRRNAIRPATPARMAGMSAASWSRKFLPRGTCPAARPGAGHSHRPGARGGLAGGPAGLLSPSRPGAPRP